MFKLILSVELFILAVYFVAMGVLWFTEGYGLNPMLSFPVAIVCAALSMFFYWEFKCEQ